ncbi:MAG: ATP-dependent DNA helicase RecG, partial [Ruminococcaceae bacterium]|nr:ATP-dependent DNA helicase RecG [Oscillospiraceae bacterium]
SSPVTVLDGVGRTRAAYYAKLGIYTLGDLVSHYPRAYENRGDVCLLSESRFDGKSAVILTVAAEPRVVRLRSHKSFLKFRAFDDSGSCEIVYFNQDYLKNQFVIGSVWRFFGKVERSGKRYTMSSPIAEAWTEDANLPPLWAVYRMTEGITPKQIAKDVLTALTLLAPTAQDPLPEALRAKRGLCTLAYAQQHIHRPTDWKSLTVARRRLVYDEFFCFAMGAAMTHTKKKERGAPVCAAGDVSALTKQLPYRLTGAQERAIAEIRYDMASDIPMSRIVVGDVGCGKTVCAAAAMLIAVQSGRQAALMAPTEILARQHYADLAPLFERMGISVGLLIGATTAAEKRKIKASLAEPDAQKRLDVVIGTHALLSDGVEFACPGLVVTDEQHRFGARQRAKLSEKNAHAHLLVMSATPIPRSLALVLYGDLELSKIDEMPPGRQRVDTFAVDESYRERLNGFIAKQVEDGGQVYVVCPAVEEQEHAPEEVTLAEIGECGVSISEKPPLKAAVQYAKGLQETFPTYSIGFVHGKMKSAEKERVMQAFAANEIQILVSTTVIEVGVNVPNACLMIVENAERFGLSQLHQLRGRVGRGTRKSYCVLVTGGTGEVGERSMARLNTMRTTYDGYAIAEQDLAQRGPGDFLGGSGEGAVRQSGGFTFRLADAGEDVTIFTDATTDARELLAHDPELSAHPLLSERVTAMFSVEEGLIS